MLEAGHYRMTFALSKTAYFRSGSGWRGIAAYTEFNANCLVLPMDFISKVIKEPDNGGFLQAHGRTET